MRKGRGEQVRDWREARRVRGWELRQKGWRQNEIAEALGVTQGAVSQWLMRAKEGGIEALQTRKAPGPRPRLSHEQIAQIPELLAQGAESFGFRGDIWTCSRIAKVIRHNFGVSYHPAHVTRILKQCGCPSAEGRNPFVEPPSAMKKQSLFGKGRSCPKSKKGP